MIIQELFEGYSVKEFFFREVQEQTIKGMMLNFRNNNYCVQHAQIFGASGSGKTSVILRIIDEIKFGRYYNARNTNTTRALLRKISGVRRGTYNTFIEKIVKDLKESKNILIIDEINDIRDLKVFGDAINTIYRETFCPIFIINNKYNLLDVFERDSAHTVHFDRVSFPPYNSFELKKIIEQRLIYAKKRGEAIIYPEGIIEYICAKVVKEMDSSVRDVLYLMRSCFAVNNFSYNFVDEKMKYYYTEDINTHIRERLTKSEKAFLYAFLDISKTSQTPIPLKRVHEFMPKITYERLFQMAKKLIDEGFLKDEFVNRGRAGGRIKYISFFSEEQREKIRQALELVYEVENKDTSIEFEMESLNLGEEDKNVRTS